MENCKEVIKKEEDRNKESCIHREKENSRVYYKFIIFPNLSSALYIYISLLLTVGYN